MTEPDDNLTEEAISNLLQKVGPLETPPEDMTSRVHAAVEQTWQREVREQKQRRWFQYAAGIAVVTASIYLGLTIQTGEPNPPIAHLDSSSEGIFWSADGSTWQPLEDKPMTAGSWLRTDNSASVSFAHGLNARINTDTSLQLINDSEVHLIEGTIYLDSYDKPTDLPFRVSTRFGTATDIGTQFIVNSGGTAWSVQVREGMVDVSNDQMNQEVHAGEKITITQTGDAASTFVAPFDDSWRWAEATRPAFSIEGRNLVSYLKWVARETGRDLRFAGPDTEREASETLLHGSIDHLTASESLEYVLQSTDIRLIDGPENVIMVKTQISH
ncbi:MAG: FecR domain-containing protein [Gammaproteobacteria bacterium]|jgi:hypothetical protein|nr:FecR domain-containing protein [Gammaproteobacteria bacterium]MBT4493506.1 FecR domain-containing protein [Gammaproteobacteria bacterium]MBT7369726.1 FecR domain-containing protein [Gammaproteobacteria bacterium]